VPPMTDAERVDFCQKTRPLFPLITPPNQTIV
jgi:hypothetical protein